VLLEDMYSFDTFEAMAITYDKNDFFDAAQPWAASDGNSCAGLPLPCLGPRPPVLSRRDRGWACLMGIAHIIS
jgi:hypothetical protein